MAPLSIALGPDSSDHSNSPPETGAVNAPDQGQGGGQLADLIHHRSYVDARVTLAEVQKIYQSNPNDFLAITDGGKVVGLCARAMVGFMLGSRYGFALYGNNSVMTARCSRPLIYQAEESLARVLDETLSRTGSEFFEDIALVDEDGGLVGLVPVPRLARLQLQLFGEQLDRVVIQDGALRQQNLELFQTNSLLRQTQGRYKALFENNALGVALLDVGGAILAHNRRFELLLQLADRPAPASFILQNWVSEADQPLLRELLATHERHAPSAEPVVSKFTFELPGGSRGFELHSSWVVETGQICVFLEDVTEKLLLEHRIARQEKQNMLDTLVAGVAHELNNKLTPVMGFAELLQSMAPESLQNPAHCIRQSASEAAQIIQQLLRLSSPSEGEAIPLDIGFVCRDALQMLRFQLLEKHCDVKLTLPEQPVWVRGNAAQLKQVLINLMLNALHATEGRPRPQLALSVRVEAGTMVLRLKDNGTGIKPADLARVFDPFFTTKGPRGTGLGLSVSLSIVQQFGGEITAESSVGVGSTFAIRFPVCETSTSHLDVARDIQPAPGTGPLDLRKRALVVDDEEFVRQFMQEALRFCFSCSVEGAADGLEAVEKLRQGKYDLILSDIRMPRMDGLQLRRWLSENRPDLTERLVFVTGHAGVVDLDQTMGFFPHPVIRKPFTMDTIASICRPILERTGTRPPQVTDGRA